MECRRTSLTVRLPGAAPTAPRGRDSTRPLADAPYDAYRVSYGTAARAVEVELVHHTLYLRNPRPPVERLAVTHGSQPRVQAVRPGAACAHRARRNGW